MTTKAIAEIANVAERTVRDWVKLASADSAELKAKSAAGRGVGADYSLEEVILIIRAGGHDTLASLLAENARGAPAVTSEDARVARLDRLEAMLGNLVSAVASMVQFLPSGANPVPLKSLPPPPELMPRDALRQIVEAWARNHGHDYRAAWSNLYREYELRYHRDLSRSAKALNISVLDYADQESLIGQLMALAYFLYGNQARIA